MDSQPLLYASTGNTALHPRGKVQKIPLVLGDQRQRKGGVHEMIVNYLVKERGGQAAKDTIKRQDTSDSFDKSTFRIDAIEQLQELSSYSHQSSLHTVQQQQTEE